MTLSEIFKMNCQQATLLCQKKSEGKIGVMERSGLWLHFAHCSLCRVFFEQSELISQEATKLSNRELTLSLEVKEKMAQAVNEKIKR